VTTRLLLALLVAAGVGTAALAADTGTFKGKAQDIAPTSEEARYKALTASTPAAKPPAGKRAGYRSGWQTSYLKGTPAKPIEAFALVYVYDTIANARRAYATPCPNCSRDVVSQGIRMKFHLSSSDETLTLVDIVTCRNVYAAIAVSGKTNSDALAQDAGALAGTIFRKAIARGMQPCAS
jgi:hypothetical protein